MFPFLGFVIFGFYFCLSFVLVSILLMWRLFNFLSPVMWLIDFLFQSQQTMLVFVKKVVKNIVYYRVMNCLIQAQQERKGSSFFSFSFQTLSFFFTSFSLAIDFLFFWFLFNVWIGLKLFILVPLYLLFIWFLFWSYFSLVSTCLCKDDVISTE